MNSVEIIAYGWGIGWKPSKHEVKAKNLKEALEQAYTEDGVSLLDLLLEGNNLKQGFMVLVDGRAIDHASELDIKLEPGSRVSVMTVPLATGG